MCCSASSGLLVSLCTRVSKQAAIVQCFTSLVASLQLLSLQYSRFMGYSASMLFPLILQAFITRRSAFSHDSEGSAIVMHCYCW